MASADICSSATTPRVYASTTQSICASDEHAPVPLGPDDVDRREPLIDRPSLRSAQSARGSRVRGTDALTTAAAPVGPQAQPAPADRDLHRRLALAGPEDRARRVDHHHARRTGQPPGDRLRRVVPGRALFQDPGLGAGVVAGRPLPVRRPDLLAGGAGPGARRRCRAPARRPAAPAPPAPGSRRSPPPGPPRRRRAAAARPSAAGRPFASTRQSGPPFSHSSCRHRPHGISGSPVASTQDSATSRPPPVACSAETTPHSAQSVTPYAAFSTLQPTTTRPSSTRPAAPTGNFEYGAYACRITSVAAARSARPVDLRHRRLSERQPLMYGLPSAAGARTRPTSPATARIVARYGSMARNWLGIGLPIAPR